MGVFVGRSTWTKFILLSGINNSIAIINLHLLRNGNLHEKQESVKMIFTNKVVTLY